MPLLFYCRRRGPSRRFLQRITDTYLQHWTIYASRAELRDMLEHANRIAPLRRSRAAISNLDDATEDDLPDLGPTPWAWLETAARRGDG